MNAYAFSDLFEQDIFLILLALQPMLRQMIHVEVARLMQALYVVLMIVMFPKGQGLETSG